MSVEIKTNTWYSDCIVGFCPRHLFLYLHWMCLKLDHDCITMLEICHITIYTIYHCYEIVFSFYKIIACHLFFFSLIFNILKSIACTSNNLFKLKSRQFILYSTHFYPLKSLLKSPWPMSTFFTRHFTLILYFWTETFLLINHCFFPQIFCHVMASNLAIIGCFVAINWLRN